MPTKKTPPKQNPKSKSKRDPNALTPIDPTTFPSSLPPGIRELMWVRASELKRRKNKLNARKHPERQTQATLASLRSNGWAGAILYNLATGKIIDGHDRLEVVLKGRLSNDLVPVLAGSWSPEQERNLLAFLDPIAAMAEIDHLQMDKLLKQIQEDDSKLLGQVQEADQRAFDSLRRDLHEEAQSIKQGAPSSFFPERNESVVFNPVTYSNSDTAEESPQIEIDNKPEPYESVEGNIQRPRTLEEINIIKEFKPLATFDIPALQPHHLADPPELPLETWIGPEYTPNATSYFLPYTFRPLLKEHAPHTILGFYVEDIKLDPIWFDPVSITIKLLNNQPYACTAPNFSVLYEDPLAVRVFQTYRSYTIARYWAELGIKIIPDLHPFTDEKDLQWRYDMIPKNAPCLACQIQSRYDNTEKAHFEFFRTSLLQLVKHLKPQTLLCYVPDNLPLNFFKTFPKQLHVITTLTWSAARRAHVPSLQRKKTTGGKIIKKRSDDNGQEQLQQEQQNIQDQERSGEAQPTQATKTRRSTGSTPTKKKANTKARQEQHTQGTG